MSARDAYTAESCIFFFSSRRRHTRFDCDWSSDVCSSDLRQMPEASKALGAEVVFETINANDLQARITAAIQSGAGADIFNFQYNWAHLYQNAVSDVSDVAGELGKAEAGFYEDRNSVG